MADEKGSDALADAWAKWGRGNDHLNELKRRSQAVVDDPDPPALETRIYIDMEDKCCVIEVAKVPPITADYPFIVSESANHFRSALDYLIIELAWVDSRGNPKVADRKQAFPIAKNRSDWNGSRIQMVMLQGLTKRHKAMVERSQPHRSWNRHIGKREVHPLTFLQDFTNDDKHKLINPGMLGLGVIWPAFPYVGRECRVDRRRLRELNKSISYAGTRIEVGTVIARIPLIITGENPGLEVHLNGHVYLGVGPGLPVINHLQRVSEIVEETLKRFEGDLARPLAKRVWRRRDSRIDKLPPPRNRRLQHQTIRGKDNMLRYLAQLARQAPAP